MSCSLLRVVAIPVTHAFGENVPSAFFLIVRALRPLRLLLCRQARAKIPYDPRNRLCAEIAASRKQTVGARNKAMWLAAVPILAVLPGCATPALVQGNGLSSYDGLKQSDGKITKSRLQVKKEQVAAAKTINVAPTAFPAHVAPDLTHEQRVLVANTVSRALCINLSDRFRLVPPDQRADLTVRAAITRATPTDEVAAGVSAAASLGSSFVDASVPIPVPRIPVGLGDMSIEAEAVDAAGRQQAAMVWGRGATAFFSTPRASKASDAYDLARDFGDDFAKMLSKGESPFEGFSIDIPSLEKVGSNIGLAPKYVACEVYGRAPGIAGLVGGKLGLPPEWTDDGPAATRKR